MVYKFVIFISVILVISTILIIYALLQEHKINNAREKINKLKRNKQVKDDLKNFPKYFINLDRSPERLKNIETEFENYSIKNYKRIKAFDGKDIDDRREGTVDNCKYINEDKNCSAAELAITMSHLKAIKTAYDDGHENAMIMEDDVEFTLAPYWGKSITEIVEEIPEDCDIFLLAIRNTERDNNYKIAEVKGDCTGVCYIVTKLGMEKIVKKYIPENEYILKQENIILDYGLMKNFKVYSYNQTLFILENLKTFSTHYNYLEYLFNLNYVSETHRILDTY
mgnify:CR=1 FL=1